MASVRNCRRRSTCAAPPPGRKRRASLVPGWSSVFTVADMVTERARAVGTTVVGLVEHKDDDGQHEATLAPPTAASAVSILYTGRKINNNVTSCQGNTG